MPLKPQVDNYVRNNRGKNSAVKLSINWYNTAVKSRADNSVQKLNLTDDFRKGKMYRFTYNATTEGLKYFDKNPLIISLGKSKFKNSVCETGLNLNLLPYNVKINFLSQLYNSYETFINREIIGSNANNAIGQKSLSFSRDNIMKLIKYYNTSYAVRNYLDENRSSTSIISYENWYRGVLIEEFDFYGFTINKVYNDYYTYTKKRKKK